jgi:hypothetical protein
MMWTMATQTHSMIQLDPAAVDQHFGRSGFYVRHELVDHPLTQLEALAQLADSLPDDRLEHNLGSVGDIVPGGEVPKSDLTPGEIVRTIESNGCWMVMGIHGIPTYEEVLDELFEDITRALPAREGQVRRRQAVIFLSAPNSTTPTHIDGEQGFLLQLTGTKRISVGTFADSATADREIERYCGGGHRNIEDLPHDAEAFDLSPGVGVHVPALTPHLVKTPAGVSISLSVGFETDALIRRSAVYRANFRLRRLGISPARPGARPRGDRAKEAVMTTASNVKRIASRRS